MEELKPCAFCGKEVRWCSDDPKDPHVCVEIQCDNCGAHFSIESDHANYLIYDDLRKLTLETWNTRQPSDQWVSVKDRLPEPEIRIMAYGNNGKIYSNIWLREMMNGLHWAYRPDPEISGWNWLDTYKVKVTHWMSLPQPPQEKE